MNDMSFLHLDRDAGSSCGLPSIGSGNHSQSIRLSACTPSSSCSPNRAVAASEPDCLDNTRNEYIHGLDFLWLELTSKCNLQCVHCYAESSPYLPLIQRMTYADWRRVLEEAVLLGCRKVQFIGGEPTIYGKLPELICDTRRLGYDFVEVFTNGTTFTERIMESFLAHKVRIAFSVYSSAALIHDSITLRKGSFAKTKASIEWALHEGLPVRVSIIEMQENASDVERTRIALERLGVKEIQVDRVRAVGRASASKEDKLDADQLCGRCWEGKLCVTPTGEMFPCVFSRRWPVGNIEDSVSDVVRGPRLSSFRSALQKKVRAEDFRSQ